MRLTFIKDDALVIVDGIAKNISLDGLVIPDSLHAIQHYDAENIECEWAANHRMIGNSIGVAGLEFGAEFINQLVSRHAAAVAAEGKLESESEGVL